MPICDEQFVKSENNIPNFIQFWSNSMAYQKHKIPR